MLGSALRTPVIVIVLPLLIKVWPGLIVPDVTAVTVRVLSDTEPVIYAGGGGGEVNVIVDDDNVSELSMLHVYGKNFPDIDRIVIILPFCVNVRPSVKGPDTILVTVRVVSNIDPIITVGDITDAIVNPDEKLSTSYSIVLTPRVLVGVADVTVSVDATIEPVIVVPKLFG